MSRQPSTPQPAHQPAHQRGRVLALGLISVLLILAVRPAGAQVLWDGWYGPLADGIMGFRFGMDRQTVREIAQLQNVRAAHARPNTLRYEGNFLTMDGELILEFAPDPTLPRTSLAGIRLSWVGQPGGGGRPQAMFEALDEMLQERYGPTVFRRDATINEVSTGYRTALHVYEGPEMQAQLSLNPAGDEAIRLMLLLVSPQIDPSLER